MAAQQQDEFGLARKRLAQRSAAQGREAEKQLKRQFARTGGIGSGAFTKTLQTAREKIGEQEGKGLEGITAAEIREKKRLGEIQEGRKFAAEQASLGRRFQERQASEQRGFAGRQADIGREFAAKEAGKGREFAATEAGKGREFQRGMFDVEQQFRQAQFDFQKELAAFDQKSKLRMLDNEDRAYKLQLDESVFNRNMADWQKNQPTDIMSSIFGGKMGFGKGGIFGQVGDIYGDIGGAIGGLF